MDSLPAGLSVSMFLGMNGWGAYGKTLQSTFFPYSILVGGGAALCSDLMGDAWRAGPQPLPLPKVSWKHWGWSTYFDVIGAVIIALLNTEVERNPWQDQTDFVARTVKHWQVWAVKMSTWKSSVSPEEKNSQTSLWHATYACHCSWWGCCSHE